MLFKRLRNIREKIRKEKLDGVLISSIPNITYLTGYANFSKDEREAYLLIGKDFQYLITDGRYTHAVKEQVPNFELFERSHQNPTEQLFKQLKNQINILGIEEDNLTVLEHKEIKKHFEKTKHFKLSRSIKTDEEIKKIEKACQIGDLAFEYILKKIKLGITEKEIAHKLENYIKEKGGEFSFPPIVAFGKNSATAHHQTGDTRLKKDQIVLLDFGVKWENYCSDMTRTVFFGKATQRYKKIYQVVLESQKRAVESVNLFVKAAKVDKMARDYIISQGFPAVPHSLGHGIGLEVHEHPHLSPKSKETLKIGMVFSIEPGIYIHNFGGVRIEDLYVLEKGKLRPLTSSQKNLIEI